MTAPIGITASSPGLSLIASPILPSDFREWDYSDARTAVRFVIEETLGQEDFDSNKAFVEEQDHWQDGDTWVGPDGGSDLAVRSKVLQSVKRQFTPVDVINEVLDNFADALLGREASVSFTPITPEGTDGVPSDAQKAEADLMQSLISAWWDRVKLWEMARRAARRARWSMRGALRVWIPPSYLVRPGAPLSTETEGQNVAESAATLPRNLSLTQALARIHLYAPTPDECVVYIDPESQQKAAVFLFTRNHAVAAEIWFIEGEGENAKATVRIVGEGEDERMYSLPIGAKLPINEMWAELLITEPIRRQQNRLNFFESLLVRVGETAGFAERYTLNAMPQGEWLDAPPSDGPPLAEEEIGGRTWYLHAVPRTLGAAITTDLRGVTTEDAVSGKESIATPDVKFKEPTNPEYAITAAQHARDTILQSAKQGHLTTSHTSRAQISGFAYEQARARFEKDLANVKSPLEGLIRDTIAAVIALAEVMSNGQEIPVGFLDRFRVVVNVYINAGPISPDALRAYRELYDDGLASRETTMTRTGIEDTTSEIMAIEGDRDAKISVISQQAVAIKALTDAGASLEAAALFVGVSEEEAKKLIATGGDTANTDITQ
jgi:hypothetical protein